MIKQHKMRLGAGVAVMALVSMACTCGSLTSGLGQAQGSLQTAEAMATGIATSGVVETVQAIATDDAATEAAGGDATATPGGDVVIGATADVSGGGNVDLGGAPDNIPVMDGAQNVISAAGTVTYTTSSDLKSVEDFYKSNMTAKGWTESQAPVELGGQIATLTYTNDTQQAVVAITSSGGQTQVAIAVTAK